MAVLLVVSTLLSTSVNAQSEQSDSTPNEKETPLVGRALADVASLAFGAGPGPEYERSFSGWNQRMPRENRLSFPLRLPMRFQK